MKQGASRTAQGARSTLQDARSELQDVGESLAFVQAFIAETQSVACDDAEDAAQVTQILEWAAEPPAELSADVLRRLITRVESLA
jgi:hypothetical protein